MSHAGLIIHLENTDEALILDPGNFSSEKELQRVFDLLGEKTKIVTLVITHEHLDHWTVDHVRNIFYRNNDCRIFTTQATADKIEEMLPKLKNNISVVNEGIVASIGSFELNFYGNKHELLHTSIPIIDNIGVNVNGKILYGGDSLIKPPFISPNLVGVPIGSPWSTMNQVLHFVENTLAKKIYLTHDALLSHSGMELYKARVEEIGEKVNTELVQLAHVLEDEPEWTTL